MLLSTSSSSIGDRFLAIFTDPAALELVLLLGFTLFLLLVFRRLGRLAGDLARRRELREYIRGLGHLVNGEYTSAVRYLQRVVDRDPEHTEARVALGDAYYALGDAAEAHRHHYHVEQVFGQTGPRVSLALGRDLLLLDRAEESVEHLERALRGEVEARPARELLVETLGALGREEHALAHARALPDVAGPRLGRLHAEAGFRALGEGRERDGLRHLHRALDLNPGLLAPRLALVGRRWMAGDAAGAWGSFRSHLNKVHQLALEGGVLETGAPAEGLRDVLERAATGGGPKATALPPGREPSRPLPGPATAALPAPPDEADEAVEATPPPAAVESSGHEVLELGGDDRDAGMAPKDLAEMLDVVVDHRARYRCGRCGAAFTRFEARCHACDHFDTLQPVQPGHLRSGREIAEVIDEIEENRYYIGRLVSQLVSGDPAAETRLLRLGAKAIPEVFQRMMEVGDNRPLIAFLKKLGPDYLDLIGNAYLHMRAFGSRNILREGLSIFLSFDRILEDVLSAMGAGAVPYLRQCIYHPDETLRGIALKALVHLGTGEVLDEVADTVTHGDLVARLNEAPEEALLGLLRTADVTGFVVRRVLVDRTFARDEALVAALDDAETAGKAAHVLARRGFSPAVFEGLVARLHGPARSVARQLLEGFHQDAHDHLVAVFIRPGLDVHRRAEVEALLARHGARTAEKIVEELPIADPALMSGVHSLFRKLGEASLAALESRYGRGKSFNVLGIDLGINLGGRDKLIQLKADLLRLTAAAGGEGAYELLKKFEGDEPVSELRDLCRRLRKNLKEAR